MNELLKHIKKNLESSRLSKNLEAQTGFEPVDTGVADHCLTTWLLRHIYDYNKPINYSQSLLSVIYRI